MPSLLRKISLKQVPEQYLRREAMDAILSSVPGRSVFAFSILTGSIYSVRPFPVSFRNFRERQQFVLHVGEDAVAVLPDGPGILLIILRLSDTVYEIEIHGRGE